MSKPKNPKAKQFRREHRRFMAGEKSAGAAFVRAAIAIKKPEEK